MKHESSPDSLTNLLLPLFLILGLVLLLNSGQQHFNSTETIRLELGRVLVLGLEFTVASDILRTAVAPTRQDISSLGAIVLLRTLLNYFLEREIRQGEQRHVPEREIRQGEQRHVPE